MKLNKILAFGVCGFLFLSAGCAVLQEMEKDVSGRHYTMKSFSLPPGSTDSVTFNVNTRGSISASLSTRETRGLTSSESGATDSMEMALYSPSDVVMIQNEGNPQERLKISYRVPRSAQEGVWKVMLTNKSERTISGTLKVYYPYEDTGGRTTPTTSQDSGYSAPQTSSSGGYEGGGPSPSSQTPSSEYGTGPVPASQSPSQTQASAPSQPQQTPQPSSQRKIAVVNPALIRGIQKPVKYGVLLNTFDLTQSDKRDKFYFHVRREGTIDVYVQRDKNERNKNIKFSVILNGPSQENAVARKEGLDKVHLQYHVKQSDIVSGKMWKVSIVRFDEVRATGNLARDIAQFAPLTGKIQVRYPKE